MDSAGNGDYLESRDDSAVTVKDDLVYHTLEIVYGYLLGGSGEFLLESVVVEQSLQEVPLRHEHVPVDQRQVSLQVEVLAHRLQHSLSQGGMQSVQLVLETGHASQERVRGQ